MNKKTSCFEVVINYLYLLWDGLGFYGFDDNKLDRLKGVKPRWYDKFTNKRWLVANLVVGILIVYILTQ
jgi:hypothetical protein